MLSYEELILLDALAYYKSMYAKIKLSQSGQK